MHYRLIGHIFSRLNRLVANTLTGTTAMDPPVTAIASDDHILNDYNNSDGTPDLKRVKRDTNIDSISSVDVIRPDLPVKDTNDDNNTWRSKLDRSFDEKDVGITQFIGHFKPFEAILKNRYEDFLVHEISKSGQTVRLIDNRMPEEDIIPTIDVQEVLDDLTIDLIRQLVNTNSNNTIEEEVVAISDDIIDESVDANADQLVDTNKVPAIESTFCDNNGHKSVKISVNGMSKDQRTRIHKAVKDNYEELETTTIDDSTDGHKYIVVTRAADRHTKGSNRRSSAWPAGRGQYIHFVLYKENKETQQAINELAIKMRLPVKLFGIAGTKDKRAITTQEVSAWKVPPRKIWSAAGRCRDVEVGHFRFAERPLRLGELRGNRFDIVLRDVECEDRADAERSLESLATTGAINYYGMQRFGYQYGRKPYAVGVLILRQHWQQAVAAILSPRPLDSSPEYRNQTTQAFNEALDVWHRTGDATTAYDRCPMKWSPEGTLLRGLTRVPATDFHGALCTGMARNQRLLYIHCYQSYVWNKSASYRVKTYGQRVVAGDLLLKRNHKDIDNESNETDDTDVQPSSAQMADNIVVADQKSMSWATIHDIVLPVMGSENLMPTNSVGGYIKQVMAEDEVTIDQFRQLPKQWCTYGTYRRLYARPQALQYEWCPYDDPNVPLVDSDLVAIKKGSDGQSIPEPGVDANEKLALRLSMTLPSSTYATIICRQLCRTETTILEYKSWFKTRYNV